MIYLRPKSLFYNSSAEIQDAVNTMNNRIIDEMLKSQNGDKKAITRLKLFLDTIFVTEDYLLQQLSRHSISDIPQDAFIAKINADKKSLLDNITTGKPFTFGEVQSEVESESLYNFKMFEDNKTDKKIEFTTVPLSEEIKAIQQKQQQKLKK